jgi:FkbM family methyltransferase
MPESRLITALRSLLQRVAGPEATLSSLPLAVLRAVGGHYATVRIEGFRLKVDLRDTVVSGNLLFARSYEPILTSLLKRLTQPGDCVLDVGAHVGYYTVLLGRLTGPGGRVLAVEPDPDNARLLRENVALNGLQDIVRVAETAAGSQPGSATLYRVQVGNRGDNRLYANPQGHPDDNRLPLVISVTPLDDLIAGWPHVDLIKMDVQGYECHVLTGLRETLDAHPSVIVVSEFWPRGLVQAGTSPGAMLDEFEARGFRLWEIPESAAPHPFERDAVMERLMHNGTYTNVLAARPACARDRLARAGLPDL